MSILGTPNDDTLVGTPGNDTIDGQGGNDVIRGLAGNDTLYGREGDDTLDGGEGNDLLFSGDGVDAIEGGAGSDALRLDFSSATTAVTISQTNPLGTASNGTTFQNVEQFYVVTGSGNDTIILTGATESSWVRSGAGNDEVRTGAGRDRIEGGEGDDLLHGGAGDEQGFETYRTSPNTINSAGIYGGAGNDHLFGEAGNDLLDGGAGDDILDGGEGNDLLFPGDGLDSIDGGTGTDALNLNFSTATTPITVNYTTPVGATSNGTTFQNVEQLDVETGSADDIVTIANTVSSSWVRSGAGNDQVSTGSGRDRLNGGNGDDILRGGAGDEQGFQSYPVSPNTFTLAGIYGEAGNDQLYGEAGNDLLDGGTGNDTLDGGEGNDILLPGDGVDTIEGGAGNDALRLDFSTATTPVTVNYTAPIGTVSNGTTFQNIEQLDVATGGNSDSIDISGVTGSSWVRSGAGNDQISTGAGRDRLEGGEGDDILRGGAGDEQGFETYPASPDTFEPAGLYGGAGNDQLFGEAGNDFLDGGTGNDTLDGGEGNDILLPGDGVDAIDGGAGSDALRLDFSTATTPVTVNYTTQIGTASNGTIFQNIEQLDIATGSTNDIISTTSATGSNWVRSGAGNDEITTGAGRDRLEGGDGDDILRGGAGDEQGFETYPASPDTFEPAGIYGGAGNDQLYGEAGNDLLDGGTGNDTLDGGEGNDILLPGDGVDAIDGGAGSDALRLDFSTATTPVTVDYTTAVGTASNGTTFQNIEQLDIATGSANDTISTTQAIGGSWVRSGAGNDVITTGVGRDRLEGGDGDDILRGGAGDEQGFETYPASPDTFEPAGIYGGAGNDQLFGEAGSDALDGGDGDDRLVGVDENGVTPGLGERETFTGGAGSDRFILGNANWIAYDDRNTTTPGTGDYALITDFNLAEDKIQLQGIAANYRTGSSPIFGVTGTAIYIDKAGAEPDELIAVLQNVSSLDLSASAFEYIAPVQTLSFSSANFTASENGTASITIIRQGETSGEASATIALTNGTAIAPADYNNAPILVVLADGELSKTITIPLIDDSLGEGNETINLSLTNPGSGVTVGSQATTVLTIQDNDSVLSFTSPTYSIQEDGTPVSIITVTRSGQADRAVGATLTLSNISATAPADYDNTAIPIAFAAGQTSQTVAVPIVNDTVGERTESFRVTLTDPTGGATLGSQSSAIVSILDDDLQLSFEAVNYTVREDGTAVTEIAILRTGRTTGIVGGTIAFTNGTATGCSCGPNSTANDFYNGSLSFTLADGETRKVIPVESATLANPNAIRIRNDNRVEASETFTITLTDPTGGATLGTQSSATVTILDDDVTLAFSTPAFRVREDGTAFTEVRVDRVGGQTGIVGATLNLTDGTAIAPADYDNAPITLSFAPGETSKIVTIPVKPDLIVEADETLTLTLTNPTGGASIGSQNSAVLTIVDLGLAPTLSLVIDKTVLSENAGSGAATGTVTRNVVTADPLTIALISSDTTEATVPATIVIPAGQASATFSINAIDDGVSDGIQQVTITASAAGFNNGFDTVAVSDVNVPDLVITNLVAATPLLTGSQTNLTYRVENQGLASADGSWRDRVYLSTDAQLDLADTLLNESTLTANIPVGSFYERSLTFFAPRTPGQYYLIATADATSTVNEGGAIGDSNNTNVIPITIAPAYRATVSTPTEIGTAGSSVVLSGRALSNADNAPIAFEFVKVGVKRNGIVRELDALTDANGNFTTTFKPLPGEAGRYEVNAYFPGVPTEDIAPEDTFSLLGMQFNTTGVTNKVLADSPFTNQVSLRNQTDVPLTGITYAVEGAPANWNIQVNVSPTLAGDGMNSISYTILAPNSSTITQDSFNIRLTSAEGVTATLPVNVNLERIVPRLVAETSTLTSGMLRGQQTAVEFTVTNEGGAATGEIQLQVPNAPWLSLASPATIASLTPGQSTNVTLLLNPATDLPLTVYQGNLFFDAPGNDGDLSLPFNFRAVSDAVGSVRVNVVNELFYFTEEAPKLANATVTLRDYFTGTEVRNAVTDATEAIAFDNLPEGAYTLEVRAENHETFKQTIQLDAGEIETVNSFLSLQTVRYIWNVTPTEIQDRYTISVESVFETNVPVPTLTIDPPVIDLAGLDVIGEVVQIDMTVTNHGLIAANDVRLNFGAHPFYKIEPLVELVDSLSAKSSLTIPVRITRIANFETLNPLSGEFSAQSSSVPCGLGGALIWSYICGPSSVSKSSAIAFNNVDGNTGCGLLGIGGGGGGAGYGAAPIAIGSSNCDPCVTKTLTAILSCAVRLIPVVGDWEKCPTGAFNCVTQTIIKGPSLLGGLGCLKAVYDCTKEAAKVTPIGKFLQILICGYGITTACGIPDWVTDNLPDWAKDLIGGLSSSSFSDSSFTTSIFTPGLTTSSVPTAALEQIGKYQQRLQLFLDSQVYLFGELDWLQDAEGSELSDWLNAFLSRVGETNLEAGKISQAERSDLLALALPEGVTASTVNRFLDRWNRSIDYWNAGIFNAADVPQGQSTDFIAFDVLERKLRLVNEAIELTEAEGFEDITQALKYSVDELQQALEGGNNEGVCAQVRIRIDQDAVMTRSAFLAQLEIDNGNDFLNLENVAVNLQVRDAQGNLVNTLFGIPNPTLAGLTAVDGTGVVLADSIARAEWTIIPTNLAALSEPTTYTIGGSLSYTENGRVVTVPLLSTPVTVYPQAELRLDYFQERNVYGDDPFTDPIETSVPFSLGVLIKNEGGGTARNLEITSAQPKIIENEKGLLVDFQIIGTRVGTESATPSLTVQFGDIAPGTTVVADWLLKSSLQGKFVEYNADFKHVNGLGNPELSLIKSVNIHELIRKVRVDHPTDDQLPDFLVNDVFDANFDPDTLYFSTGTTAPVNVVTTAIADSPATIDDLQVQVSATTPTGWVYWRLNDPGSGIFQVQRILRSDGTELRPDNYWTTDRTFPATGRPISENILHLLDFNSTGSYTVIYTTGDETGPQVRDIVDVEPDPRNTPIDSIDVTFTEAIRAASFDYTDLSLTLDNGSNLITAAVTIGQINPTTFRINNLTGITGNVGQYQLSIRASGIEDLGGIAGTGTVIENWLFTGDRPAVANLTGIASNLRNLPVEFVDVNFTEPINPTSFDISDLLLTRNGGGNLITNAITISQLDATTYRVGNLTALTTTDGSYQLLITANGVLDSDGNSGIGGRGFNWTMETGIPVVSDIVDLAVDQRRSPVQELDVVFSDAIDLTTFDASDISLIRNGSEVLPLTGLTIAPVLGSTYRMSGFASAQLQDGNYVLTVNGANIQDGSGNVASGSASESWTLDTTTPTAPTSISLSPDRGISETDLITNTTTFTVSGTLAEPGLSVFLTDQTSGTALGQATVTGTTFSHPIALQSGGSRSLEVRVVDAAGNSSTNTFNVFIDQTKPTVLSFAAANPVPSATPIPFFDIVFSEAIHAATFNFNDLTLTRDSGTNLITSTVTITQQSANTYRINGLSDLTQTPGRYELTVNTNGIEDRAGNLGDTQSQTTFVITAPPTPGFAIIQTNGNTIATEGGSPDTYTIALRTQPTSDVTVAIAIDPQPTNPQITVDKTSLTFTPANWNIPQVVTVAAVNDSLPESTLVANIRHTVTSSDPNYSSLNIPNLITTIADNDAAIQGIKWNDLDGDSIRDVNEPGLANWTIYLDANANSQFDAGERSTQTDANGNYRFDDLRPGTYTVAEVLQNGWRQTFPDVSVTTTRASIPLYTPSLLTSTASSATTASQLTNLTAFRQDARFSDIDGSGFTSVVIDTGIDLNHPFFGADTDGNGIADRIIYQYDFADNDADASDRTGHGSHVASIIGSSDSRYTGIAPNANLIALKVFRDNGAGYFSDLEESLQWVIHNASTYNIASVNLSLGDERNWNTETNRYGIGDELAALAAKGIILTAAAGNNFAKFSSTQGLAYPASDPSAIAVGAVWGNSDQIADFSQRHALLSDIFAPGIPIVGANATGGITTLGGTSQAAPHIAGIAVLAQQLAVKTLDRKLTIDEFRQTLVSTADLIQDGDDEQDAVINTGLTFKRVNMLALAEAILALDPHVPSQPVFNGTPALPGSGNPTQAPLNSAAFTHTVTLVAGQTATEINFGNRANQIPQVKTNTGLTLNEAASATLTTNRLEAIDSDNSSAEISYTITDAPDHGVLLLNTIALQVGDRFTQVDLNNNLLTYQHNNSETQNDRFKFTISDGVGGSLADQTFNITINPVNDAPIVTTPIANQVTVEGTVFSFKIASTTFTDSDPGDRLTYTVSSNSGSRLPNWLNFDATTQTLSGTPQATDAGTIAIQVTATDTAGESANTTFLLTVNALPALGTAPPPINFQNGGRGLTRRGSKQNDRIQGSNKNDILRGGAGNDRLIGGGNKDRLYGDAGNDQLFGGQGHDLLSGGAGNDRLLGEAGDDVLVGDQGKDSLTGGSGKDLFVFNTATQEGDRITDFNRTEDLIDLRRLFQAPQFAAGSTYAQYSQFIQVVQIGANAAIQIDADGTGIQTKWITLVTLDRVAANSLTTANFVL